MKTKSSPKFKNPLRRLYSKKPSIWGFNSNKKGWRAKSYRFKISPTTRLYISVRRFKTSPTNRSKKYIQTVFTINTLGIKEVAIRKQKLKAKTKKAKQPILKPSFSSAFIVAGLVGVVFFASQAVVMFNTKPPVVRAEQANTIHKVETKPIKKQFLEESLPKTLIIPSIDTNADIKIMGQKKDGTIETPDIFDKSVGWYKYSPTPGEQGPAVLLGHVDNYKGPSVFWRLSELAIGSEVKVKRADDSIAKFNVTRVEQYSQDNFPTEKVYGNTDNSELRLITCGGSFSYFTLRYSANTVVYAKLVI